MLTLLTFTPLLGILTLWLLPAALTRALGRLVSGLVLAQTIALVVGFNAGAGDFQFVEKAAWIPSLGVEYHVGLDGLSLPLVALTALLIPFALEIAGPERASDRSFCALVLLLQTGLLGTFTALNFIHWFIYWELGLVPAYFLIKIWGRGHPQAAATQFFVYTFGGSVAMLLAMQGVFLAGDTFDLTRLRELAASGELTSRLSERFSGFGPGLPLALFLGVFVGLAVKIPLFPFHGWLAPTYASAPPSVTVLLTGAMSKMGIYGLLRILLPIFPEVSRTLLGALIALSVVTILFAAFAALGQPDLRRMLAYSSMNHLGYAALGLWIALDPAARLSSETNSGSLALSGVMLQLFNHGVTAAALWGCVQLLENRTGGESRFSHLGGLRVAAPVFAGLMGISVMASLGLPGLNGFVGEFLIFAGAFPVAPVAAALALPGLLITAWFLLRALQAVFFGPPRNESAAFADLATKEIALLAPAVGLMFLLGWFPQLALRFINSSVQLFLAQTGP